MYIVKFDKSLVGDRGKIGVIRRKSLVGDKGKIGVIRRKNIL